MTISNPVMEDSNVIKTSSAVYWRALNQRSQPPSYRIFCDQLRGTRGRDVMRQVTSLDGHHYVIFQCTTAWSETKLSASISVLFVWWWRRQRWVTTDRFSTMKTLGISSLLLSGTLHTLCYNNSTYFHTHLFPRTPFSSSLYIHNFTQHTIDEKCTYTYKQYFWSVSTKFLDREHGCTNTVLTI